MKKIIALLFIAIFALASCKVYHYQDSSIVVYDPTITDDADQPNQWLKDYSADELTKTVVFPDVDAATPGATIVMVTTTKSLYVVGAQNVMDEIQLGGYATGLGGGANERYELPTDTTTGIFGVTTLGPKTVHIFFVPATLVATDGWTASKVRLEFAEAKANDWNALKRVDWVADLGVSTSNPYLVKENADYFQVQLDMTNGANGYKP